MSRVKASPRTIAHGHIHRGRLSARKSPKGTNITIGAAYLLLGIVGFFLAGTAAHVLALNTFDHFLHLASAIVLLGVGLTADRATGRSGRTATA